ncbi:MAG: hypothetical protein RLZZ156_1134 [Deinococcota bacterium]|jgi:hypothetical protein
MSPNINLPSRVVPLGRARAGWTDNLITIVLGLWLIAGVFIDGFAHSNLRGTIESFFTPWHAILYAGFTVSALWTMWLVYKEIRLGRSGFAAIPIGYELGLLGILIFGLGGIGDMIWHSVFGIEVGNAALLSPSHLMLLCGGTLLVTSPLRSGWATLGYAPKFLEFLPVLLSSLAAFSFATFFQLHAWGLTNVPDGNRYMNWVGGIRGSTSFNLASNFANMGILFSNVILLAPVLLLLRRWQTPLGAFTILFTLNTIGMTVIGGSVHWQAVIAMAIAGLFADGFIALFKPSHKRILEFRALAMVLPLIIWGGHFLVRHLQEGIALELEFWTGTMVMAAFTGLVLSVLVAPPEIPKELEA